MTQWFEIIKNSLSDNEPHNVMDMATEIVGEPIYTENGTMTYDYKKNRRNVAKNISSHLNRYAKQGYCESIAKGVWVWKG